MIGAGVCDARTIGAGVCDARSTGAGVARGVGIAFARGVGVTLARMIGDGVAPGIGVGVARSIALGVAPGIGFGFAFDVAPGIAFEVDGDVTATPTAGVGFSATFILKLFRPKYTAPSSLPSGNCSDTTTVLRFLKLSVPAVPRVAGVILDFFRTRAGIVCASSWWRFAARLGLEPPHDLWNDAFPGCSRAGRSRPKRRRAAAFVYARRPTLGDQ